jgi:molybdopterin converting factor small subunit
MVRVTVRFWGSVKRPAPRSFEIKVNEPATVRKAITQAAEIVGGTEAEAVERELLTTAAFFINGDSVEQQGGLEACLANGDTLGITLAVSGG